MANDGELEPDVPDDNPGASEGDNNPSLEDVNAPSDVYVPEEGARASDGNEPLDENSSQETEFNRPGLNQGEDLDKDASLGNQEVYSEESVFELINQDGTLVPVEDSVLDGKLHLDDENATLMLRDKKLDDVRVLEVTPNHITNQHSVRLLIDNREVSIEFTEDLSFEDSNGESLSLRPLLQDPPAIELDTIRTNTDSSNRSSHREQMKAKMEQVRESRQEQQQSEQSNTQETQQVQQDNNSDAELTAANEGGSGGSGGDSSPPPNQAPTLADLASAIGFNENTVNAAAQILDSAVTFTDDSVNLDAGQIVYTYSSGGGAEDQMSVSNGGNITFDGTNVTFAGAGVIATINGANNGNNGANLTFDLTSLATATRVDELLQQITYQNTSNTPTATRTISITISDGDGGTSTAVTSTITVTAQNDAPTVANAIADQALDSDVSSTFQFNSNVFSDPEGDAFTYTATQGDDSALDDFISFDAGTRTFSYDHASLDRATYDAGSYSVKVNANDGTDTGSDTFNFTFDAIGGTTLGTDGVDNATGTTGADTIYGFSGNDTIDGGRGADTIVGGQGDDTLVGGYGSDTLLGGAGDDTIYADNQTMDLSSLGTLQLWVDANNPFATGAGTDNTAYSSWTNLAGSGIGDFSHNSSSVLDNDAANGRAAFQLDGSDYFSLAYNANLNTSNSTVFSVGNLTGGSGYRTLFSNRGYYSGKVHGYNIYNDDSLWVGTNSSGWGKLNTDNVSQSTPHINTVSVDGSNVSYYHNDESFGTQGDFRRNTQVDFIIGANDGYAAQYVGNVSEFIVFSTTLSDDDRRSVNEYLAMKYNSALEQSTDTVLSFGTDTLTGGSGADTFIWTNSSHSGVGAGNRDIITDFSGSAGDGDQIDIQGVAANILFTGNAGLLGGGHNSATYTHDGGNTILQIDYGGDGAADMEIQLTGEHRLDDLDVLTSYGLGTQGGDATLTSGDDIYRGSGAGDTINADDGDDVVLGEAGNDTIDGQRGDDILIGGAGDDTLVGGYGGDTLIGGSGNDIIYADNEFFVIGDFSSAQFWLDASNYSSMTDDGGGLISNWASEINSYNAASSGSTRGTYTTNAINGRAGIALDGVDDGFVTDYTLTSSTDIFVVASIDTYANRHNSITGSTLNDNHHEAWVRDDHLLGFRSASTSNPYVSAPVNPDSAPFILEHTWQAGGNLYGRFNGTQIHSNATVTSSFGDLLLGLDSDNTSSYTLDGNISEVLVFNTQLSEADREQVNEYLAFKYSIALTGEAFGVDTLTGGSGADTFTWTNASHSGTGMGNRDQITDFSGVNGGENDVIDLSTLTGNSGEFNLVGNAALANTGNANQIAWSQGTGGDSAHTIIQIDFGGDGTADMEIQLNNFTASDLTSADFVFGSVTGTSGDDILTGGDGAHTLVGGAGDDTLILDLSDLTQAAALDGGTSTNKDILQFDADTSQHLDLTAVDNTYITNIEKFDLTAGTHTLTLNETDVLDVSSTSDDLFIDGDAADTINIETTTTAWSANGTQTVDSITYNVYTHANGTDIFIDQDITTINLI